MSRRRRNANPFSLFSFQDIVTSVTAVLILMTLFLAVELVHRKLNAPPAVAANSIATLRNAIEEMNSRIAERRKALQQSHNDLRRLASDSPEELRAKLAALSQQAGSLQNEKADLDEKAASLRQELAALTGQDARRQELRQRLSATTASATEAERELQKKKAGGDVVYNPAPESGKRVWLVVANRAGVSACAFSDASAPREFSSKLLDTAAVAFDRWLSTRSADADCFFVLARPEGIKTGEEVIEALRKRGFDTGFDLIGQQERVALPTQTGTGS